MKDRILGIIGRRSDEKSSSNSSLSNSNGGFSGSRREILRASSGTIVAAGGIGTASAEQNVEKVRLRRRYDSMDLVRREFDKHAGEVLDELHQRDLIENNSLDEIPALYGASDPFSEDSDIAVDVHGSGSDDVDASREILAAVVQDTSDRRVTVTVEPGRRRAYAFDRTGVNSVSTIASHCSGPSGEPYIVCGQSCGDCSWSFSYPTKAYWKYPYPEDSGCYDLEYYGCNMGSCSESCF